MNQDVGHRADLVVVCWVDDAVPAAFPVAARDEPSPVLDDIARLRFPYLQVHGLLPLLRQVHNLYGLIDVYRLFVFHQLNVLSKVLSNIRPSRFRSTTLWMRCAYW